MSFHALKVLETREEIGGAAKSVAFDVPKTLRKMFHWRPGQHLSLRFVLDGEEHRRSYSISSAPGTPLRITVKRVEGGRISNYINDHIQPGDVIEVMPPFGSFCLDPAALERRTHYFIGAGSGVTPLNAMLHAVMNHEPHSFAHLMLGNRDEGSVLLADELSALAARYPERMTLHHVLTRPGWWSGGEAWRKGRVDADAIKAFVTENRPYAQDTQFYVCGPGRMNADIRAALMALDVPASRIHSENFGGDTTLDTSVEGIAATADITLNGQAHTVEIHPDETVLQAARREGLTPPYSCQSGVCGACRARLTGGTVHMRARMALEDADIKGGAILTCQSVATSEKLTVSF